MGRVSRLVEVDVGGRRASHASHVSVPARGAKRAGEAHPARVGRGPRRQPPLARSLVLEYVGQSQFQAWKQRRGQDVPGLARQLADAAESVAAAPQYADDVLGRIDEPILVDSETLVQTSLDGFVPPARRR